MKRFLEIIFMIDSFSDQSILVAFLINYNNEIIIYFDKIIIVINMNIALLAKTYHSFNHV